MKDFYRYIGLVLQRCFSGIFWFFDAFGVAVFVLSLKQPNKVPWQASLAVFIVALFASTFAVWLSERQKVTAAVAELSELKESIPIYKLEPSEIENYSIQKIVTKYESGVRALANRIEQSKKPGQARDAFGLQKIAEQFRLAIGNIPGFGGVETLEEKHKRLGDYLAELKSYQDRISHIVKLSLLLEGSKSDSNIEVSIEADDKLVEMFVDDEYVESNIPETDEPGANGWMGRVAIPGIGNVAYKSDLYLSGYGKGNKAYSKISKINAKKEMSLFNEDFYIYSPSGNCTLKITIHSEKRLEPQELELAIDLSKANLHELDKADEGLD